MNTATKKRINATALVNTIRKVGGESYGPNSVLVTNLIGSLASKLSAGELRDLLTIAGKGPIS